MAGNPNWGNGKSGNPGGRPKLADGVKEAARAYTLEAIEKLATWMRSDDSAASVRACQALLDRGWGRPEQAMTVDVTTQTVMRVPQVAKDRAEWEKLHTPSLQ